MDGRVYSGRQARKAELVDAISRVAEAADDSLNARLTPVYR